LLDASVEQAATEVIDVPPEALVTLDVVSSTLVYAPPPPGIGAPSVTGSGLGSRIPAVAQAAQQDEAADGAAEGEDALGSIEVWFDGNTLWYRIYDPEVGNWVAESFTRPGPISQLTVKDGVVAWVATWNVGGAIDVEVCHSVYDQTLHRWVRDVTGYGNDNGTVVELTNRDGVVAWVADWQG
jgi:hypothetical protein